MDSLLHKQPVTSENPPKMSGIGAMIDKPSVQMLSYDHRTTEIQTCNATYKL